MPITVPCGRCIGCRLEKSRQWAIRCMHESEEYKENSYITLTYNENKVPSDNSVNVVHFQKFMKRLRKHTGKKIRYFHCGEYGDQLGRPHYHAILFNLDFEDKELYRVDNGYRIYTSKMLEKIWGKGFCTIGEVTFESCAYVARYVIKKINGEKAESHYKGKSPEYITMSRRPGIGKKWLDKYISDVYPQDKIVVRHGVLCRPPRFYDNQLEKIKPLELDSIKRSRRLRAELKPINTDRLDVKEKVQELKANRLVRKLEIK